MLQRIINFPWWVVGVSIVFIIALLWKRKLLVKWVGNFCRRVKYGVRCLFILMPHMSWWGYIFIVLSLIAIVGILFLQFRATHARTLVIDEGLIKGNRQLGLEQLQILVLCMAGVLVCRLIVNMLSALSVTAAGFRLSQHTLIVQTEQEPGLTRPTDLESFHVTDVNHVVDITRRFLVVIQALLELAAALITSIVIAGLSLGFLNALPLALVLIVSGPFLRLSYRAFHIARNLDSAKDRSGRLCGTRDGDLFLRYRNMKHFFWQRARDTRGQLVQLTIIQIVQSMTTGLLTIGHQIFIGAIFVLLFPSLGSLSAGTLVGLQAQAERAGEAALRILEGMIEIQRLMVSAQRLLTILDKPRKHKDALCKPFPDACKLIIEGVVQSTKDPISGGERRLYRLSDVVEPGEIVALVGPDKVGKTNLILRTLPGQRSRVEGEISVEIHGEQIPIEDIDPRVFSVSTGHLFAGYLNGADYRTGQRWGTVRDLFLSAGSISEEQIWQVSGLLGWNQNALDLSAHITELKNFSAGDKRMLDLVRVGLQLELGSPFAGLINPFPDEPEAWPFVFNFLECYRRKGKTIFIEFKDPLQMNLVTRRFKDMRCWFLQPGQDAVISPNFEGLKTCRDFRRWLKGYLRGVASNEEHRPLEEGGSQEMKVTGVLALPWNRHLLPGVEQTPGLSSGATSQTFKMGKRSRRSRRRGYHKRPRKK